MFTIVSRSCICQFIISDECSIKWHKAHWDVKLGRPSHPHAATVSERHRTAGCHHPSAIDFLLRWLVSGDSLLCRLSPWLSERFVSSNTVPAIFAKQPLVHRILSPDLGLMCRLLSSDVASACSSRSSLVSARGEWAGRGAPARLGPAPTVTARTALPPEARSEAGRSAARNAAHGAADPPGNACRSAPSAGRLQPVSLRNGQHIHRFSGHSFTASVATRAADKWRLLRTVHDAPIREFRLYAFSWHGVKSSCFHIEETQSVTSAKVFFYNFLVPSWGIHECEVQTVLQRSRLSFNQQPMLGADTSAQRSYGSHLYDTGGTAASPVPR